MGRYSFLIVCIFLYSLPSFAGFYDEPAGVGFYWYQDPVESANETKNTESKQLSQSAPPVKEDLVALVRRTPRDEMLKWPIKRVREAYEATLDRAVSEPSYENMETWYKVLTVTRDKAVRFSNAFVLTAQAHPVWSQEHIYPGYPQAANYYRSLLKKELRRGLQSMASRFALVVFKSEGCPYCESYRRILDTFHERVGWDIRLVEVNDELKLRFGITTVPFTIVVAKNNKWFPVAAGFVSFRSLAERVYRAAMILDGASPEQVFRYLYPFDNSTMATGFGVPAVFNGADVLP